MADKETDLDRELLPVGAVAVGWFIFVLAIVLMAVECK